MASNKIAFIGSVGIPNLYGGFESFLEATVPVLVTRGYEVFVTCDRNKYKDASRDWFGAIREFISVPANGVFSIFHDLIAFLRIYNKVDVIVVLGVSAGVFFPFFRSICFLFGTKLIVNVDGIEWRRAKFGLLKRYFLRISDAIAQAFSHVVIIDNRALFDFLTNIGARKSVCIPYSGDYVIKKVDAESRKKKYLLSICRIEPENNCELIVQAFSKLGFGEFIFVGNWAASSYGLKIREKYKDVSGLHMLDPIYDKLKLAYLRSNCVGYIHGHSVGGTNPSLVEMLFYDCPIAAFDCVFNRDTAEIDADYFITELDLINFMNLFFNDYISRPRTTRVRFTTVEVVNSYIKIFEN